MNKNFEQFLLNDKASKGLTQFSNKIRAYQYKKPFTVTSKFLSPAEKALDWGCGNGHLSTFLLHCGQKTTAYGFGEIPESTLLAANPLLEFIAADTTEPVKLPFEDGSFDLVLSMGVLEHVHESGGDQLASLKEINRILKGGGYFLCFHLPYSGSWVEKLHTTIMPLKKHKSYVHTKRFSKNDVTKLNYASGFHLQEWGRYNFLPRNFSHKLPLSVANNTIFASSFNALDTILTLIFPYFCNQSYFIAQKDKQIT